MTNLLLVFAGGGAGSVLRYLIGLFVRSGNVNLPLATFLSNMIACAVFALVVYYDRSRQPMPFTLSILLLTGFCGGLSTFSTFGYETFLMFKNGMFLAAALNILVSTALSLAMFFIVLRNTGHN